MTFTTILYALYGISSIITYHNYYTDIFFGLDFKHPPKVSVIKIILQPCNNNVIFYGGDGITLYYIPVNITTN